MAVEMIKTMRQVVQTAPFAGWFDSFLFLPGITSKTLGVLRRETSLKEFFDATDAQLREFVRRTAGTTYGLASCIPDRDFRKMLLLFVLLSRVSFRAFPFAGGTTPALPEWGRQTGLWISLHVIRSFVCAVFRGCE